MLIKKYKTQIKNQKPYLVQEKKYEISEKEKIVSPEIFYKFCIDALKSNKQAEEYVYIICLNSKNIPIGLFEVSHGSLNASIMNPREIFQKALLIGAASIIITHNHPSGDPESSSDDIKSTKRIIEAGLIIGISVLDHIITGNNGFLSMKERGYI